VYLFLLETLIPAMVVWVLGVSVGSFLNVVVYRLPAGISLLYPPSRCPKCETLLRPYDNVPVLGWLWLAGRCRYCKATISLRYPVVEFVTGALFFAVFGLFGWSWATVGYWLFVSLLLVLALIDFDTMTLPSSPMVIGVVAGWIFQVINALNQTDATPERVVATGMGAIGASVLGLWLVSLIRILGSAALNQDAMGGADSKLAAMLGAWLGWQGCLLSIMLAALLGAILGGIGMGLQLIRRRQAMPFGPFLALGAGITLFHGQALIQAYLRLFFPNGL
jgi:leader peptidase (prepilin peptidase) / N-methyltransferase